MRIWRAALLGVLAAGSTGVGGCGSEDGKKAAPPADGGAAGEASMAEVAGAGNAPIGGSAGGEPSMAAAGTPPSEGGAAVAGNGAGGNGGSDDRARTLTRCDEPLVVDDADEASIAPNQPTIFQAPGGLTLLTWKEAAYRKGRVLGDDDSLGSVVTFPNAPNSSDQIAHYVASGPGRLAYLDWEHTSVTTYDVEADTWSDPDVHAGLYFDLVQFLASGDTLHVVTDAVGSVGSLQVRSPAGVWATPVPAWSWGTDKISLPELMLDGHDDGALVAGRQPDTFALVGWVIRGGDVVAEASLPIAGYLTSLDSALLPNGDVLLVFQQTNDAITRATTLSYESGADEASFSSPIELVAVASQVSGLAIDSRGDATLVYGLGGTDQVRRRIDGSWRAATELPFSDNWWADPLVDANDTVFLARALNDFTLRIISSAAGETTWSAPVDVPGDFGWSYPQRPRMGLHSSGQPMVIWQGTNESGGSDILLSVCH